MNMIFNIHPFADKNGLCGRVVFNLLCASERHANPTIPLYELSVASQGRFVIALRTAQFGILKGVSVVADTARFSPARPDGFHGPAWKRKSSLASRGIVNHGLTDLWHYENSGKIWYECRWAKDVDFTHLFDVWDGISHPEI